MNKRFVSVVFFSLLLTSGSCNNLQTGKNSEIALQESLTKDISSESTEEKTVESSTTPTLSEKDEEVFAFETLTIQKDGPEDMNVHYKYVIDYPVQGPEALVNLIKETIFKSLGDSVTTHDFTQEKLEALGDKFISQSIKEIKEEYGGEEEERTIGYGDQGSIKITDNTANYLNYFFDSYLYTGGAHGMPTRYYLTIDKKNCKILGWDDIVLSDKRKELEGIIQKALSTQYYKDSNKKWDDAFFKFSLPAQTPALTTNGILFMYSAYEIDCYAAGTPYCTIPYKDIMDFLTPEVKALIQ